MGKKKINVNLLLGILILTAVAAVCITSFFYMPYAPNVMDNRHAYMIPGKDPTHIFGTDQFGRDILSRIMVGSRTVLLIGFVSVLLGGIVGSLIGAAAGMIRGRIGASIMRVIDGLMAFPGTLLALMLVAAVGKGQTGAIIAISIYTIAPFARIMNSLIYENAELLMVKAAKSIGVGPLRLLTRYYLPMVLPKLLTQFSASVGHAIMTEASLSFLGLGVQPPNASWGLMLSEAKQYALIYPYLAAAPGAAIFFTVLGFNLLSDGLNDILIGRRAAVWKKNHR